METLVNKQNSQIRITAPEIESYREFYTLSDKDFHYLFKMEDWTLVEEEPEKKGFGEKCECREVTWSEEDENNMGWLIAYLKGKNVYHSDELHKSVIKWLKSLRPQPKRKQSPALKKIVDNLTEERLAKTRAEMKTVEEEPEGWNKADCVKEIPFSLIYEEFAEHWRLGKAVEPGDYYIPISRLRWGIKGNLEEIPSNVDLEKEIKKHTDLFHADIEYPLRLTAIKFYELGRKGGSK